jgi:ribose transport system substrate-binding protein
LAALLLAACGGLRHSAEENYVLVTTRPKLAYWQAAAAGLRAAADQLGVKSDFVGPDTYDVRAQQEEFRRTVAQKPAGILVSPAESELMRADINQAIEQGIPVITIDSDAPASKRLLFIGTNNYQAGMIGGRVLADRLMGKGKVVVYTMPRQRNLNERLRGYQDFLGDYPGIKIAEVVDIKGDPGIAAARTRELIIQKKNLPDAFVCLEASSCQVVADVLDRNKILDRVVIAMDTDLATLEWIQKGLIAATIAQKPYTMAFVGLKMLDDLHHHKLPSLDRQWRENPFAPIPTFVDTGATLIDRSNVGSFLEAQRTVTAKQPG